MIVAWTGHRPDLFENPDTARTTVERAVEEIRSRASRFLLGGQRGVDTWAALAAITCGVPYALILPHAPEQFAADWRPEDRQVLTETMQHAAEVHIATGYTDRNRRLATSAGLLIAVWTGIRGGGTYETIEFARQAGTPVREFRLAATQNARWADGRGI